MDEHPEVEMEVKIHRGLQVGPDGCLYFGTAGLPTTAQRHEAPGGRLFRYDPQTDKYDCLGRPVEHDYIQTIDVDHRRGIIYGATYPCGNFFGWDIAAGKLLFSAYIADYPHQVCVDDRGVCWASYSAVAQGSHRPLLKYDPDTAKLDNHRDLIYHRHF